MAGVPITTQLLQQKGFEEKVMFGQTVFIKGECALVHVFEWVPCNVESGRPISSNIYVKTWDELAKIMQEGGVK